jgi:amphi-Trp domain-containing protein
VEEIVKDLKFEQKSSLSRLDAADLFSALAVALRRNGTAKLDLGQGTLTLRFPEEFRSEIEIEVDDGQIELEIELKWPAAQGDGPSPS